MVKMKIVLTLVLIGLLAAASFFGLKQTLKSHESGSADVFVGIDVVYDDGAVEDIRSLVDRVKDYTNLIVVGSSAITYNETKLNEAVQYIFDEMGGQQVDQNQWMLVNETNVTKDTLTTRNYTDVANKYLASLDDYLK